jgi:hypothetical protein
LFGCLFDFYVTENHRLVQTVLARELGSLIWTRYDRYLPLSHPVRIVVTLIVLAFLIRCKNK